MLLYEIVDGERLVPRHLEALALLRELGLPTAPESAVVGEDLQAAVAAAGPTAGTRWPTRWTGW